MLVLIILWDFLNVLKIVRDSKTTLVTKTMTIRQKGIHSTTSMFVVIEFWVFRDLLAQRYTEFYRHWNASIQMQTKTNHIQKRCGFWFFCKTWFVYLTVQSIFQAAFRTHCSLSREVFLFNSGLRIRRFLKKKTVYAKPHFVSEWELQRSHWRKIKIVRKLNAFTGFCCYTSARYGLVTPCATFHGLILQHFSNIGFAKKHVLCSVCTGSAACRFRTISN